MGGGPCPSLAIINLEAGSKFCIKLVVGTQVCKIWELEGKFLKVGGWKQISLVVGKEACKIWGMKGNLCRLKVRAPLS